MKVLITGCGGQLANQIIISKPRSINLIKATKLDLNVTCQESCYKFIDKINPDWIINCAAYTNVDKSEINYELAYSTNALAPKYLAEACKEFGGNIIQISTDYVFNGENDKPYLPNEKKSPINKYGLTKSIGEDFLLEKLCNLNKGIILRTSWLMGSYGNNFALKILKLLNHKKELNIVCDQFGSPTSTSTLATACWKIIELKSNNTKISPILHFCDQGLASWYEIANFLAEKGKELNIINKYDFKINPIPTSKYPTPAKRPRYSVLDCQQSLSNLSLNAIPWKKSLEDELKKVKKINDKKNIV